MTSELLENYHVINHARQKLEIRPCWKEQRSSGLPGCDPDLRFRFQCHAENMHNKHPWSRWGSIHYWPIVSCPMSPRRRPCCKHAPSFLRDKLPIWPGTRVTLFLLPAWDFSSLGSIFSEVRQEKGQDKSLSLEYLPFWQECYTSSWLCWTKRP